MPQVNVYAGGTLDRAARRRGDARWLAARRDDPKTRYIAVWRGLCLVRGNDPPRAAFLSADAVARAASDGAPVALLGIRDESAHFAIDVSDLGDDPATEALAGAATFQDLRAVGGLMPAPEAALMAHARGLMHWHARHRFCAVCGRPSELREAGHQRVCTDPACAAEHFPRTDPAVIVLVSDGDRCLMGRRAEWPAGMYSTLAGFVEPGESLEEAVVREIGEEAGIAVRDVRYQSSQPWPFPASLMLGFYATAASTEITVDHNELEDARWFDRAALMRPAEGFRLPRRDSIARCLVEDWLSGEAGG